jgi:hypothetical protein
MKRRIARACAIPAIRAITAITALAAAGATFGCGASGSHPVGLEFDHLTLRHGTSAEVGYRIHGSDLSQFTVDRPSSIAKDRQRWDTLAVSLEGTVEDGGTIAGTLFLDTLTACPTGTYSVALHSGGDTLTLTIDVVPPTPIPALVTSAARRRSTVATPAPRDYVALAPDGTVWEYGEGLPLTHIVGPVDVIAVSSGLGVGPVSALTRDGKLWSWRFSALDSPILTTPPVDVGAAVDLRGAIEGLLVLGADGTVRTSGGVPTTPRLDGITAIRVGNSALSGGSRDYFAFVDGKGDALGLSASPLDTLYDELDVVDISPLGASMLTVDGMVFSRRLVASPDHYDVRATFGGLPIIAYEASLYDDYATSRTGELTEFGYFITADGALWADGAPLPLDPALEPVDVMPRGSTLFALDAHGKLWVSEGLPTDPGSWHVLPFDAVRASGG